MIKSVVAGPLAVVLVTALPLVLVTVVLGVLALVSLLPAAKLRAHVCQLIGLLTAYAAVLQGAGLRSDESACTPHRASTDHGACPRHEGVGAGWLDAERGLGEEVVSLSAVGGCQGASQRSTRQSGH